MSEKEPVDCRQVLLLPDAGPLITLAYADVLDLLLERDGAWTWSI